MRGGGGACIYSWRAAQGSGFRRGAQGAPEDAGIRAAGRIRVVRAGSPRRNHAEVYQPHRPLRRKGRRRREGGLPGLRSLQEIGVRGPAWAPAGQCFSSARGGFRHGISRGEEPPLPANSPDPSRRAIGMKTAACASTGSGQIGRRHRCTRAGKAHAMSSRQGTHDMAPSVAPSIRQAAPHGPTGRITRRPTARDVRLGVPAGTAATGILVAIYSAVPCTGDRCAGRSQVQYDTRP